MAAPIISAKVEGLEELKARFTRMRQNVRRAQIEQLQENAESLASEIQAGAPVGETGELEISVGWLRKGELKFFVKAGGRLTLKQGAQSRSYDYSRAQEFGTIHMPANPFFFVVYRRRKSQMRRAMAKAARAAIRESLE